MLGSLLEAERRSSTAGVSDDVAIKRISNVEPPRMKQLHALCGMNYTPTTSRCKCTIA
jgi:hypothetical protein